MEPINETNIDNKRDVNSTFTNTLDNNALSTKTTWDTVQFKRLGALLVEYAENSTTGSDNVTTDEKKTVEKMLPGWGPDRPTFTMEKPAKYAVFNSITNNPAVGDERDFVRIAEINDDKSETYRSDIQIRPGKSYEVFIYYHNNASATLNDAAHNYVGGGA